MSEVYIPAPRRRRGAPPNDELTICYTKKHGLGWALFHPGCHVAHSMGGFAIPDKASREDVANFCLARETAYQNGEWVNLDRYDFMDMHGIFPCAVREVDLCNAVRKKKPNGPAVLAVLRGMARPMPDVRLFPSRECPNVNEWEAWDIGGIGPVAIRWR